MRKLKIVILFIFVSIITVTLFSLSIPFFRIEYEKTARPSYIRDGDTFEIPNYPAIRLADIDCPESDEQGGPEATFALTQLIGEKKVYLDIDDVHQFDTTGTRYVCLVYVDFNSTHYLNVNQAMIVLRQAVIDDHDNEWNPDRWSLYVAKPSNRTVMRFLGGSAILSLLIVIGINKALSSIYKIIRNRYKSIFSPKPQS